MLSIAFAAFIAASSPIDEKRSAQIDDLQKIIALSGRQPELLFRLADLWLEDSRAHADDGASRAKAIGLLAELAQRHADFARADEVLFLLGKTLLDTNDERRAVVAFQRLTARHPHSRFVAESHFALGEHLFSQSNGRRDWLTRALASYVAASGAESPVRSDALYKQGWCLLNLGDFDGAKDRFTEVISLGGARSSDAERDFVRAYEKGGGTSTSFPLVSNDAARQRTLKELLARLYADDGFDGQAALTWQALIAEQPKAPQALGYQQHVIESLLRMGKKPLVVAQVQRLVSMAAEIPGDVSGAEPLLASIATGWHSECRKTREDGCLAYPSAIYDAYLALFPNAPHAYELRFFHAELLYDLSKFERAAAEYRAVMDRDVECKKSQRCSAGRFMEAAAWGEIKARDAVVIGALPTQGEILSDTAFLVASR